MPQPQHDDTNCHADTDTGSTSCWYGCGGNSRPERRPVRPSGADADAKAKQNAVNANVSVSITRGNVYGGWSERMRDCRCSNRRAAAQTASQARLAGSTSCWYRLPRDRPEPERGPASRHPEHHAKAKQDAVNANVP